MDRKQRFDALFAEYGPDIVAYCGWRARSGGAQDAAAETFLIAWRRLDKVPEDDATRVWLYATARRVIANQRRSARRRAALQQRLELEAAPASTSDPEETLVYEALDRLAPRRPRGAPARRVGGLSPAEIARVAGCLTVTARGRLHRARRRFRAVYEELRGGEAPTQVFRRRIHEHV